MPPINHKTTIPIPWAVSMISVAIWIGVEVHSIRVHIQSAWTVHDMSRWEKAASLSNPTLNLPDAYAIARGR